MVSKIEENSYHFTGIDVEKLGGIRTSMNDYVNSIEEVMETRKGKIDPLTKTERKCYQKYTGKVNWIYEHYKTDLAVVALQMSRKSISANFGDLKGINHEVIKIRDREHVINYSHVNNKEDLKIIAIGDASYKVGEKTVGGELIMIANEQTSIAVP